MPGTNSNIPHDSAVRLPPLTGAIRRPGSTRVFPSPIIAHTVDGNAAVRAAAAVAPGTMDSLYTLPPLSSTVSPASSPGYPDSSRSASPVHITTRDYPEAQRFPPTPSPTPSPAPAGQASLSPAGVVEVDTGTGDNFGGVLGAPLVGPFRQPRRSGVPEVMDLTDVGTVSPLPDSAPFNTPPARAARPDGVVTRVPAPSDTMMQARTPPAPGIDMIFPTAPASTGDVAHEVNPVDKHGAARAAAALATRATVDEVEAVELDPGAAPVGANDAPTQCTRQKRRPGRPRKRTVGAAAAPQEGEGSSPAKETGAKKHYSSDEALYVAKAWIRQSRLGPSQQEERLYEGVADWCRTHYGMDRTANSVKSFWGRLAHETQIFLACESAVIKKKVSGSTVESRADMVMQMYRVKNRRKEKDGSYSYAPVFKYIQAARFLEMEPKFSENYGVSDEAGSADGSTAMRRGSGDADPAADAAGGRATKRNARSSDDEDRTTRPIGGKAKKAQAEVAEHMKKSTELISVIAERLQDANTLFKNSTEAFEQSASESADRELLKSLPHGSPEYVTLLNEIMRERVASRVRFHHRRVGNRRRDSPIEASADQGATRAPAEDNGDLREDGANEGAL